MAYGNIYATSNDGDQTPIQSFVNLNLQADPTMYQVEIQAADPGKKIRRLWRKMLAPGMV